MTVPVPPVLTIEDIADRWCKESGSNFKDVVSVIIRAMNKHKDINAGQTSLNAWATASIGPDGEDISDYTGLETLDDPAWDLLDYIFSHPLNIPEEEIRIALRLKCFDKDTFLKLIQLYGDCPPPTFWGGIQHSIEEIITIGRGEGKSQREIAYEIDQQHPGLTARQLGFLLPAKWKPYNENQKNAARTQGRRLRGQKP